MAPAENRTWTPRRWPGSLATTSGVTTIAILCAVLWGAPAAHAQDGVDTSEDMLTNVAMLRVTANEAVSELLAESPVAAGDVVTVRPGSTHKSNWIVAESLTRALTRRGIEVHVIDDPPPSTPDGGGDPVAAASGDEAETPAASFDLTAMAADAAAEEPVEAGDGAAMSAAGVRDVTPEVGRVLEFRIAQFDITYAGQSRSFVLGPKRVTRVVSVDIGGRLRESGGTGVEWIGQGDAVRIDRISRSQLAAFESTDYSAELPEGGGALRYIEPVVVGGIVAGLVYLFYTNQN